LIHQIGLMYRDDVEASADALRFLRVIGDPHRWSILSHLAHSDRRVGELTTLVGERQNLVSYHLRELRDVGLVSARRSAYDGRDTYYRLDVDRCGAHLCASAAALHPALRFQPEPSASSPRRTRPPRVLFLCTGNSARSQMAEALARHRVGPAIEARSAGSHPKPLHPYAVRVMAERGIDIAHNRTKHLRRYARHRFDAVVTLCDKVREVCPDFPGDPTAIHWSMPDPAATGESDEETYAAFVQTADELETRVGQLAAQLFPSDGGASHGG
jgi:protein-tyrosine-phosphatase/DNA-binding transcriptional ArsR family regulator